MVKHNDVIERFPAHPPVNFTLRQLECFRAVAALGSISGAASALNASDSAVSDALTAMERALRTTLFNRQRSRGASLTSDGLAVAPIVHRMLAEAEELAAAVGHAGSAITGPVRLAAVETLAPVVVPRVIEASAARFPGLRVDYSTGDQPTLLEELAAGDVDLVLTFDIDVPPELHRRALYSTQACLVVSIEHPFASRDSVSLEDVSDEPMVLLDIASSRVHTLELMSSRSISPRIAFRTSNYELCRSLVGRGLGYSLLMRRGIDNRTWDGGRIVSIPIEPEPRTVDIMLVWAHSAPPPRIAAVIDLATEVMRPSSLS